MNSGCIRFSGHRSQVALNTEALRPNAQDIDVSRLALGEPHPDGILDSHKKRVLCSETSPDRGRARCAHEMLCSERKSEAFRQVELEQGAGHVLTCHRLARSAQTGSELATQLHSSRTGAPQSAAGRHIFDLSRQGDRRCEASGAQPTLRGGEGGAAGEDVEAAAAQDIAQRAQRRGIGQVRVLGARRRRWYSG
ncbi:MAG: hypothetical protein ACREF4_10170 [Gammaproteobacteria bacterium]